MALIKRLETLINYYERGKMFAFCVLNRTILQDLNILLVNHIFGRYNCNTLDDRALFMMIYTDQTLVYERAEPKILHFLRLKHTIRLSTLLVSNFIVFVHYVS